MTADILQMAREAGAFRFANKCSSDPSSYVRFTDAQLTAFVARVRAEVMEEAAQIAESDEFYGNATQHAIAAAIRAQEGAGHD